MSGKRMFNGRGVLMRLRENVYAVNDKKRKNIELQCSRCPLTFKTDEDYKKHWKEAH